MDIPQIGDEEKLWLNSIMKEYEIGEHPNSTKIFMDHLDKFIRDFDPAKIDDRLLPNGEPNLLAVYATNQTSHYINEVERIILYIRQCLVVEKETRGYSSKEISGKLSIEEKIVQICLKFISQFPGFMDSGNGTSGFGLQNIGINRIQTVQKYISFTSVLDLIDFQSKSRKAFITTFKSAEKSAPDQSANRIIPNTAFILMWINENHPELQDVHQIVKEVFEGFKIKAVRADEIQHQDKITDIILKNIRESEFLFADLTGERPNVYYVVGYAHAINKRPILFRKQGTSLHFDLSIHNAPEYKNITDLREKLKNRLEAMTGRKSD